MFGTLHLSSSPQQRHRVLKAFAQRQSFETTFQLWNSRTTARQERRTLQSSLRQLAKLARRRSIMGPNSGFSLTVVILKGRK